MDCLIFFHMLSHSDGKHKVKPMETDTKRFSLIGTLNLVCRAEHWWVKNVCCDCTATEETAEELTLVRMWKLTAVFRFLLYLGLNLIDRLDSSVVLCNNVVQTQKSLKTLCVLHFTFLSSVLFNSWVLALINKFNQVWEFSTDKEWRWQSRKKDIFLMCTAKNWDEPFGFICDPC